MLAYYIPMCHFDPKGTTGKNREKNQLCHILVEKNGKDAKAYWFRNSSVLSK